MNDQLIKGTDLNPVIIAIDNGNGNTKTEHLCFKSGVESYVTEPVVNKDYFKIGDKYYIVGESHMTYQGDKTTSEESRILTIAAIVKEMEYRHMTEGKIRRTAYMYQIHTVMFVYKMLDKFFKRRGLIINNTIRIVTDVTKCDNRTRSFLFDIIYDLDKRIRHITVICDKTIKIIQIRQSVDG